MHAAVGSPTLQVLRHGTENGGPRSVSDERRGTAGFIKRFGIVDTVAVTGLLRPCGNRASERVTSAGQTSAAPYSGRSRAPRTAVAGGSNEAAIQRRLSKCPRAASPSSRKSG